MVEDTAHRLARLAAFRRENSLLVAGAAVAVFLGDSLTEAFDVGAFFPGRPVLNRGIDGERLDEPHGRAALHRLGPDLLAPDPETVLVQLGVNDLVDGATPPVVRVRYAALLDALRARWPRARLVCQSLLPVRGSFVHLAPAVREVNAALAALAAAHGALWIDLYPHFADRRGLLRRRQSLDGVHLRPPAYAAWSAVVASALGWSAPGARASTNVVVPISEAHERRQSTPGESPARESPPLESTRPDPTLPLSRAEQPPLHRLVEEQASRRPHSIAITDGEDESFTYGELVAASRGLAGDLRAGGVARGDVVAIWADRSVVLPCALLGVLGAGAAFAILDPSHPVARLSAAVGVARPAGLVVIEGAPKVPAELTRALDEAGCRVRLTARSLPRSRHPGTEDADARASTHASSRSTHASSRSTHASSREGPKEEPRPRPSGAAVGPPQESAVEGSGDDLAYVAFTSGTTGQPKGILGAHAPLPHFLRWHVRTFGFGTSDTFAMLAGLAHDPLLRDVFTPLTAGGTLVVPPASTIHDPSALRAFLAQQGVTAAHLTPSLGQLLCHGHQRDIAYRSLPALRWAFFGGEQLDYRRLAQVRALAPNATVVNFYGTTETPQAMGFHVVAAEDERVNREGREVRAVPVGRGIAD